MATALSNPYTLVSEEIKLSAIAFSWVTQSSTSASVTSNSSAGTIYVSYRYTQPFTSAGEIINAAVEQKTPVVGSNQFSLQNLTIGAFLYVGIAQDWSGNRVFSAGSVQLLSALPGPIAPEQSGSYPDQIFYEDVPLMVDLSYGWRGSPPLSFSVQGLPPGVSASLGGSVIGVPTSIATVPCKVTVSNDYGSVTSEFTWYGMTLPKVAVAGMTRAELLRLAKAYADREDIEVADHISDMLRMAEDRMSRVMRNREMASQLKIPIVDGQDYYALPADFAGMRYIKLSLDKGVEQKLTYVNPVIGTDIKTWQGAYASHSQYTILNNMLYLPCPLKGPGYIELSYYQRVPQLIDDDDTNWVLTNHRDIYLDAISAEIERFAKNDERYTMLWSKVNNAFEEIASRHEKDVWSGGPLTIDVEKGGY